MNETALAEELLRDAGGEELLSRMPPALLLPGEAPDAALLLQRTDGGALLTLLLDALRAEQNGFFAQLGLILGVLLLSAVLEHFCASLRDGDLPDVLRLLSSSALSLFVFGRLKEVLAGSTAFFAEVHSIMGSACAAMTGLLAASGAVTAAAVSSAGLALFLSTAETVCTGLLLPVIRLCCGIAAVSAVSDGAGLSGISDAVRRTFLFLTGALMTVLSAVISYQTILARSVDSLSMRAVRFTLAGAVPIVGGAVGEAASAVAAGFALARKTAGLLGLGAILFHMVPPLVSVFSVKLLFSAGRAGAALFGLPVPQRLFAEGESLAGFLCAVMSTVCVLYILLLSLCMQGG